MPSNPSPPIPFDRSPRLARWFALASTLLGCSVSTPPSAGPAPVAAGPDDARGARLYDNWRAEKKQEGSFTPDSAKTPELDGKGGPNGNGTLNDGAGRALPNTGHDYRLKNLFGWDLRGSEGLYGAAYHNKAFVLSHNLLADRRSAAELRTWLAKGGDGVPAFESVLDDNDLDDLVAFLDKTRSGALAGPAQIFRLDAAAPKSFVLNAGGDAARGKQRFASTCAKCHGADGRKIVIDDTESVGSITRSSAYEIWFKILHGQPGSTMKRQVTEAGAPAQSAAILDLLAALCDRSAFPPGPGAEDVKDGDPRCGAYLR